MGKVQWTKPQLIVIARGTPEESVLQHCKEIGTIAGPAGQNQQSMCSADPAKVSCATCHSRGGS